MSSSQMTAILAAAVAIEYIPLHWNDAEEARWQGQIGFLTEAAHIGDVASQEAVACIDYGLTAKGVLAYDFAEAVCPYIKADTCTDDTIRRLVREQFQGG